MEKVYGNYERIDRLIQVGKRRWLVYFGLFEDANGKYIFQQYLTVKPSLDDVKRMIINAINSDTQEKIMSGFKWKGNIVWLSEANQLNYSRDFAIANYCEKKGEEYSLPTYKFGTDDAPVYYSFGTFDDFFQFNRSWANHIADILSDCWNEKRNIVWDGYVV